MKCFRHQQADAVGTCKYCFKAMCPQCARDLAEGLVCSAECEAQVKKMHDMVERSQKMYAYAPKMHSRSAILLAMMSVLFIGFGAFSDNRAFSLYLIIFGLITLCGAAFAFFNKRKIAKIAGTDRS